MLLLKKNAKRKLGRCRIERSTMGRRESSGTDEKLNISRKRKSQKLTVTVTLNFRVYTLRNGASLHKQAEQGSVHGGRTGPSRANEPHAALTSTKPGLKITNFKYQKEKTPSIN